MSKELYWRSKWLCDKWGHAYVQGLGRGESVDLKKWEIRIIFPYCDEIKKRKKIFSGVINCFTRIRENKIIYIPGGQKRHFYENMHFSFCAAFGNTEKKNCYHRTPVCLDVNHKKALNDALLSGTSANASIHLSGCVWGQFHSGFSCAGKCMGDTTKWEPQISTDLIRLVITLQQ